MAKRDYKSGNKRMFEDDDLGHSASLKELAEGNYSNHATRHEAGGDDEVTLNAAAHADTHVSGGTDPLADVVFTAGNQTVAGVKTFSDTPKIDNIAENSAGHGVIVDGITLKDDLATSGIQAALSAGLTDKTRHINLLPAGAIIPAASGCGITQTNGTNKSYFTLDFDKDADEWCFFHFVVPDAYDGGNVVFNVWCISTATSGDVHFVIYTADVEDAASYDAALGTTVTLTHKTVDGSAGDAFVATGTADPGWTAGRLATLKLMRDISEDDAAADINVLIIEIEYEVT